MNGMITFDEVINYDNLLKAYNHCRKGKSYRNSTVNYHMNYVANLHRLLKELQDGTYKIKNLYQFVIYEPKKRNITANQFEDKIVQRVICKYALEPTIAPKLIYDNYASQPGKGNKLAIDRLQKFIRSYAKEHNNSDKGWVLTCDIRKFFYTIDRDVCYEQVKKLDIDDRLKELVHQQIQAFPSEYNEYTDDPNKGLCIGFQTSQWLAVYYLNGLDHFIKEKLHIKYYGRYMDDFNLIHENKEYLSYCESEIRKYVTEKLKVELNHKTHIHPLEQGVCFLGYRCKYNNDTKEVDTYIRGKSIQKLKRRTRLQAKLIRHGEMNPEAAVLSVESWHAYAMHGETQKSINALCEATKMIEPFIDRETQYQAMLMNDEMIDPDGFIILRYRDEPEKSLHYTESKKEYDDRIHREEVIANYDYYYNKNMYVLLNMAKVIKAQQKKNSKKNIIKRESLDYIDDALNELIFPDTNRKVKKEKKPPEHIVNPWKFQEQYRDENGFIKLVRKV